MWKKQKVSLIFPTYNEKDSIREAIIDFEESGYIDEIIVVNNNAAEGTSEEVAKANSKITKEVFEDKQGYGFAIRRGFDEATGDLIMVSEPDGTFFGNDVVKLLSYSDDFDIVYGSRTSKELIWKGANMGWFLRWGNLFVAKLMEVLFNTTNLTDVGCTMRVIKASALEKIKNKFTIGKEHFGPEMMLLSFIEGFKSIQIPVNYQERVGESSVTGDLWKAFKLGVIMIMLIIQYRLKFFGKFHWPGLRNLITQTIKKTFQFIIKIPFIYYLALAYFLYFWIITYIRWKAHTPIMDYHAYVQMMWNTVRGKILFYNQGRNLQAPFFSLHFAPTLILLTGFYKLFSHQLTLMFVFKVLTSASLIPIFYLAKDILKNKTAAYLATFVYMMYPPLVWSHMQGFAEEALATSFLIFAFYYMYNKKPWPFVIFGILTLGLRINMVLPVFMLGLYAIYSKKARPQGIFLSLLSVVWLLFLLNVLNPNYAPKGGKSYVYNFFKNYGDNPTEMVTNFFLKPQITLETLSNPVRALYVRDLFMPMLFLSFLSPMVLMIAAPSIIMNLLSHNTRLSMVFFYYHSAITPFIIIAGFYGIGVFSRFVNKLFYRFNVILKTDYIKVIVLIVMVWFSLFLNRNYSFGAYWFFGRFFNQLLYEPTQRDIQVDLIGKNIPKTYALGTNDRFMEHLMERKWYFGHNSHRGMLPDVMFIDPWRDSNYEEDIYLEKGWERIIRNEFLIFYARQDLVNRYNVLEDLPNLSNFPANKDYTAFLLPNNLVYSSGFDRGSTIDITGDVVFVQKLSVAQKPMKYLEIPVEKLKTPRETIKTFFSYYVKPPRGQLDITVTEGNKDLPSEIVVFNKRYNAESLHTKTDILNLDLTSVDFDDDKTYWLVLSLYKDDGKDYDKYNKFRVYASGDMPKDPKERDICNREVDYEIHDIRLSADGGVTWRNPYCDSHLLFTGYDQRIKPYNNPEVDTLENGTLIFTGTPNEVIKITKEIVGNTNAYKELVVVGKERLKE